MALIGRKPIREQIQNAIDRRIDRRVEESVETALANVPEQKINLNAALKLALTEGISAVRDRDAKAPYASNPYVYRCVNFIGTCAASAPLKWYLGEEEQETGDVQRLFEQPNPYMSGYQLIEATFTFLELFRMGCIWQLAWGKKRVPGRNSIPREIWVHSPARWTPKVDKKSGMIVGWVYGPKKTPFTPEEIVHFKYFSPYHSIKSHPSITAAMQTINTEAAAKKYELAMYKNGCFAGGFLKTLDTLPKDEKTALLETFEGRHQGEGKYHRIGLLEGGMDYIDATKSLKDMLAKDLHELNARETMMVFGLSLTALGIDAGGGSIFGPNVKQARAMVWQDNIAPKHKLITGKLIPDFCERFGVKLTPKFDTSKIPALQEEEKDKWERAHAAMDHGMDWIRANERFKLEVPDIENMPGAELNYMPMNMVPVGGAVAEDEPASSKANADPGKTAPDRLAALIKALPTSDPVALKKAQARWRKRHGDFMKGLKPLQSKFADMMHTWVWELRKEVLRNFYESGPDIFGKKAVLKQGTINPNVEAAISAMFPPLEDQIVKLGGMAKPHLEAAIKYGGDSIYAQLVAMGSDVGMFSVDYDQAINYLLERTVELATPIETTYEAIRGTLVEGFKDGSSIDQVADKLRNDFSVADNRAKLIAHEEIIGTAENGKYMAMKKEGIKKKQWLHGGSVKEPRPTHVAADGEVVDIEELFSTGLMHAHDWENGSEEDNLYCHCDTIMPEIAPDGHEYTLDELMD